MSSSMAARRASMDIRGDDLRTSSTLRQAQLVRRRVSDQPCLHEQSHVMWRPLLGSPRLHNGVRRAHSPRRRIQPNVLSGKRRERNQKTIVHSRVRCRSGRWWAKWSNDSHCRCGVFSHRADDCGNRCFARGLVKAIPTKQALTIRRNRRHVRRHWRSDNAGNNDNCNE